MIEPTQLRYPYIFTLTAGRTGTAWLAQFLSQNLGLPATHEPLGIGEWGIDMPDIRVMRSFNEYGFNSDVRAFWDQKLRRISDLPYYIETNHTLGKCGLIEALTQQPEEFRKKTLIVVMTRDPAPQSLSYIGRHDFANIASYWQWYLAPDYQLNLFNAAQLQRHGNAGTAVWYTCEMAARQHYYLMRFRDRLNFCEYAIEDLSGTGPCIELLMTVTGSKPIEPTAIPSPANTASHKIPQPLVDKTHALIADLNFDPHSFASSLVTKERHRFMA